MTFEEILTKLNKADIIISSLSQTEKGWSLVVRKKKTPTFVGYGSGKKIKDAVSMALGNMRDSFDEKGWPQKGWPKPIKGIYSPGKETSAPKKKKRVRL